MTPVRHDARQADTSEFSSGPLRVAVFGVQHGQGAVQFASSGNELMWQEQGGPLTQPPSRD